MADELLLSRLHPNVSNGKMDEVVRSNCRDSPC
jgi:hypothetical protein